MSLYTLKSLLPQLCFNTVSYSFFHTYKLLLPQRCGNNVPYRYTHDTSPCYHSVVSKRFLSAHRHLKVLFYHSFSTPLSLSYHSDAVYTYKSLLTQCSVNEFLTVSIHLKIVAARLLYEYGILLCPSYHSAVAIMFLLSQYTLKYLLPQCCFLTAHVGLHLQVKCTSTFMCQ